METLLNEAPLHILPTLAHKVGLHESIVLQQIHYRLKVNYKREFRDDQYWVFNTFDNWKKEFFFLSEDEVKEAFQSLVNKNLLLSGDYALSALDTTQWYALNYQALEMLA